MTLKASLQGRFRSTIEVMDQQLALAVMLSGESVFLTGPAGSGKTYILNQFIRLAKKQGKYVSVTATTGLAATHLGGTTIHSWSGIGIHDSLPQGFLDRFPKGRREIIKKTDILVIDEISMLHDYRLDMVDEICRLIREKPLEPFGGIQVIMSGDFFQLPPINHRDSRPGGFVVNSSAWSELDPTVCYLEEQYRQDDEALLGVLSAIRSGKLTQDHIDTLTARSEVHPDELEDLTELYTVNVDVDKLNEAKLAQIDDDEISYERVEVGPKGHLEVLGRSVLAPKLLKLKRGALVMAVKNSPDRKYVNGSIGVVVDFESDTEYPIVKFRNGKEVLMVPDSWELRDGDEKRASISQIPLRLAWAITVHKSQGMTLDTARMNLAKAFVEGMGYVALSRVKNVNSLYLSGINQMALRVSEEAMSIDGYLREKSATDAEKFIYLVQ